MSDRLVEIKHALDHDEDTRWGYGMYNGSLVDQDLRFLVAEVERLRSELADVLQHQPRQGEGWAERQRS